MIATEDIANALTQINQSEIFAFLNYTEILQLKSIITKIRNGHDNTDQPAE